MSRDLTMLRQVVRCLSARKGGPAALKRKLDMRRKYLSGTLMEAVAAVDREFRRKMQRALETHLAPKHRWVLKDLMQEWGWESGKRLSAPLQREDPAVCGYFAHRERVREMFDLSTPVD
jgi:hypothetical protein